MFCIGNADFFIGIQGFIMDDFLDFLHVRHCESFKWIGIGRAFLSSRDREDQLKVAVFKAAYLMAGAAIATGVIGFGMTVQHCREFHCKTFHTAAFRSIKQISVADSSVSDDFL